MRYSAWALSIVLLGAAPSAFAQGPPQGQPQGPPPEGGRPPGGPGGPPPGPDRGFLYAQMMRGIDEKVSLLLEQGKQDAAIEELKRALTVDVPKSHPAYEGKVHLIGRLAITYTNTGKKKEAVDTIQGLLAEVPPGTVAEASAWLNAGVVYRQAGMPEEALKAYDRAIALSEKLAKAAPSGPGGRPPAPGSPNRPPKGD